MSVYKEGYYAVELINKASKQIYSDACDYGAPVKKGDSLWNWTKQLVEWYGVQGTRQVSEYGTGATVEHVVELMDEWNTGRIDRFKVSYITTRGDRRHDGYVTVSKY